MMESTYLKERLERIASEASAVVVQVNSEAFQEAARAAYGPNSQHASHYPAASGGLTFGLQRAGGQAATIAQTIVPRIEVIEREHQRLVSIFESLDIELDEETLATLELIGGRSCNDAYKEPRRDIRNAINKAVRETQEAERDYEHDQATDGLIAAGFACNEADGNFTRGNETVVITLVSGRECRYEWGYEREAVIDVCGFVSDSGKSGEFSRLLSLINPEWPQAIAGCFRG